MGLLNHLIVRTLPLVPRPLVGRVAARYVAGSSLDDAVRRVRELNALGAMATLDLLGEEVRERSVAEEATAECVRILEAIEREKIDSNLSIKLTLFGLKFDPAFCATQVERIVRVAHEKGLFVRIDMEDAPTTDATLELFRTLHERYGNVGCVLQAYMRRTLDDIAALPRVALGGGAATDIAALPVGVNVRLCKGIYVEPRRIAWKGYETVRNAYVNALEKLLRQGAYAAIATHDEYLVSAATGLIDRFGLARDQYEFQMLLGVDEPLRDLLLAQGHRVRIYTPYGRDWYAYSLRRLRENPEVAGHVARAFFRRAAG